MSQQNNNSINLPPPPPISSTPNITQPAPSQQFNSSPQSSSNSFGQSVYDDTASLGTASAYIGAITGTVIGIIFAIIGFVLLRVKNVYTSTASATITSASCLPSVNSDGTTSYNCVYNVSYSISGTPVIATLTTSTQYTVGNVVSINYNPNQVTDIEVSGTMSTSQYGVILIIISILVVAFSWLMVYLTRKSKMFAAYEGVGEGLSLLNNRLRI